MTRKHTNNWMQGKQNIATKITKQKAEWISNMKNELKRLEKEPKTKIHNDSLRITLKNTKLENVRPWWHTWIWLKKFTSIQTSYQNEYVPSRSRRILINDQRKDHIDPKRPPPLKGITWNNYRPITCLPMTWKILTAQIREEIYDSLTSRTFTFLFLYIIIMDVIFSLGRP